MLIYFLFAIKLLFLDLNRSVNASYCNRNCTTLAPGHGAELHGTFHPIACRVENAMCSYNSDIGSGNVPKKVSMDWYLALNDDNVTYKIALNFSWRPSHDSSFETLRGYRITILKTSSILDSSTEELYYCLDTGVEYYKHVLGIFHYDCYGIQQSWPITPGDEIHVIIDSLPDPNYNSLYMDVTIPDCSNAFMHAVKDCIIKKQLVVNVVNLFCENQTVVFDYNVPAQYGSFATLRLCQGEDNDAWSCITLIKDWDNMPLNGTVVYAVPTHFYDSKIQYTLSLLGSHRLDLFYRAVFMFSDCSEDITGTNTVIVLTFIIPTVIFFIVLLSIAIRNFQLCNRAFESCRYDKGFLSQSNTLSVDTKSIDHKIVQDKEISSDCEENSVCVYLVFVEDNSYHKDVMLKFASYLQKDLGFHVIFELWEQLKTYENAVEWMVKSLKKASKIIVVWSPGAAFRYNQIEMQSNMNTSKSPDMFTPVVKRIFSDIFVNGNKGKYFFVQFAFWEWKHGNALSHPSLSSYINRTYTLMEDFSNLYFSLKDQEKYVPGGYSQINKVDADQYFNPELNEVGGALKDSINRLRNKAKSPEVWFGDSDDICEHNFSIPDIIENVEIQELNIVPPLDIESLKCDNSDCGEAQTSFELPITVNEDIASSAEDVRYFADHYQNKACVLTNQFGNELHNQQLMQHSENISLLDVNTTDYEGCVFHRNATPVQLLFIPRPLSCANIAPIDEDSDPMENIMKINRMQGDNSK